jgi:hypothetical protein
LQKAVEIKSNQNYNRALILPLANEVSGMAKKTGRFFGGDWLYGGKVQQNVAHQCSLTLLIDAP